MRPGTRKKRGLECTLCVALVWLLWFVHRGFPLVPGVCLGDRAARALEIASFRKVNSRLQSCGLAMDILDGLVFILRIGVPGSGGVCHLAYFPQMFPCIMRQGYVSWTPHTRTRFLFFQGRSDFGGARVCPRQSASLTCLFSYPHIRWGGSARFARI